MRWLRRGEVLAPLLVLAVLVCQGFPVAMHGVTGTELGEREPTSGPAHARAEGASPSAHAGIDGAARGYAAVPAFWAPHGHHTGDDGVAALANHVGALVFFVAAALWSLLTGLSGWRRARPPELPLFRKPHLKAALRPPPAPTVSVLQVFRL
ncbi:hypothetical protein [Rubrobacter xylanophilus]|uniref:hypothetical protein n=1 Tax=Rubrobacter xylanophilus TaxID=49319 RepID=UPI001C640E63|nr:hypothetical protein [Rubrobacter xylanophilus]